MDPITVLIGLTVLGGAALLSGCTEPSGENNNNEPDLYDADEDGYTDCNAPDEVLAELEAGETCDCDDSDAAAYQYLSGYPNLDSDDFTTGELLQFCTDDSLPEGYSATQSSEIDCDDNPVTGHYTHPGAPERLDGRDTNCDGTSDIVLSRDAITILDEDGYEGFGSGLAFGDVNGDNYDDLIIGYKEWKGNGLLNSGRTYVVFGDDTRLQPGDTIRLPTDADITFTGNDVSLNIGRRIGATDLDGDGKDEMIISVNGLNNSDLYFGNGIGDNSRSGALLFVKGRTTFDSEYILTHNDLLSATFLASNDMSLLVGHANSGLDEHAVAGDIDGDGIGELIIENKENGVTMIPLQAFSGVQTVDDLVSNPSVNTHKIISSVVANIPDHFASGDVNGDGLTDLLLGDTLDWFNGLGRGILILGASNFPLEIDLMDPTLPQTLTMLYFPADEPGFEAGSSVHVADLDGDGLAEVIIGAQEDDTHAPDAGCTYVLYGQDISDALAGTHASVNKQSGDSIELNGESTLLGANTICGDIENAWVPRTVFTSDTNGDNRADLLLGSDVYGGGTSPGAGFYFSGYELSSFSSAFYLSSDADHEVFGEVSLGDFGTSGAGNGDFNGDGAQDVAFSAPDANAVYVMLGGQ